MLQVTEFNDSIWVLASLMLHLPEHHRRVLQGSRPQFITVVSWVSIFEKPWWSWGWACAKFSWPFKIFKDSGPCSVDDASKAPWVANGKCHWQGWLTRLMILRKLRHLWVQGSLFTLKGLYVGEGLPSSTRLRSSERLQSKMFHENLKSRTKQRFMHCKTTQTRVSSESQYLSKKWINVWPGLILPSTCS